MSKVTAVFADGSSIDASYDVGPILPPATEVEWSSLNPQPGEDLYAILKRVTTPNARVLLPSGDIEWRDNVYPLNGGNWYGFIGNGKVAQLVGSTTGARTRLVQKANSFTHKVPGQTGIEGTKLGQTGAYGTYGPASPGFRIAGAKSQTSVIAHLDIVGAQQTGPDGKPMVHKGYEDYIGVNGLAYDVGFYGLGHANGNSPAVGEEMGVNAYDSTGMRYLYCAFDAQGVGGGFGSHGSIGTEVGFSTFTGTPFSGVTSSYRGTPADANASGDEYFHDSTIIATGSGFPGKNYEQCTGTMRLERTVIQLRASHRLGFDAAHISILSQLPSGAQSKYLITDVTNDAIGPANGATYKGALVIAMPIYVNGVLNTVPVDNVVVTKNGVRLTPVYVYDAPPAADWVVDPAKNYVCVRRYSWGSPAVTKYS